MNGGSISITLFGIAIPFPNNLSVLRLPRAETAPVANAGTAFEIADVAWGGSLVPSDESVVNKFPLRFTDFLICVLLIFTSVVFYLTFCKH